MFLRSVAGWILKGKILANSMKRSRNAIVEVEIYVTQKQNSIRGPQPLSIPNWRFRSKGSAGGAPGTGVPKAFF
jgi:hypothetical protein